MAQSIARSLNGGEARSRRAQPRSICILTHNTCERSHTHTHDGNNNTATTNCCCYYYYYYCYYYYYY